MSVPQVITSKKVNMVIIDCSFIVSISKLGMSELRGNALKRNVGGAEGGSYGIGRSVLCRGKVVASTYRLYPRSRTGVSLILDLGFANSGGRQICGDKKIIGLCFSQLQTEV